MTFLLSVLIVLYALLVIGMYVFQRKLMYLPSTVIEAPEAYGLEGFGDVRFKTEDGLSIQLWHRPAAGGFPTIVYFHGNAANLANRAGIYAALAEHGFGVLAVSYRGYGKSEGSPSEDGLYKDARGGIRFLTEGQKIPLSRIVLFGESLGSGVAVQMATEFDIAAIVLEAPYTSVVNRAAEIYFYVPVRFLIKDRFDSIRKISRVKAPVLIFHGELDETIPPAHGRALMEAATAPKQAFFFPLVGHNDFDSELLASHMADFARQHRLIAP